jgi:hypothetical protein
MVEENLQLGILILDLELEFRPPLGGGLQPLKQQRKHYG